MATTVLTTSLELGVGLVSIPVKIKKVSDKEDVEIKRASPDGNPLGVRTIDKVTGEVVELDAVRRGVFDGDTFREIPAEALEAITEQTKLDSVSISEFIPLKDLPMERVTDAYFLAANGNARPLKLMHDALVKTKRAGIGKLVFRSRQRPFAVYPQDGGLFLVTLAWASDFKQAKEASEVLEGVAAAKEEVAVAVELIEALSADADALDRLDDDLIPLKAELVERALAGQAVVRRAKEKKAVVAHDGMMEALRASVEAAQQEKVSA